MKIFLIGPMGSGKSKIGKILSSKLDKNLFDLDKEIEKGLNLSINEIFKLKGEAYFRGIETKCEIVNTVSFDPKGDRLRD